jgi:hypothetical protein
MEIISGVSLGIGAVGISSSLAYCNETDSAGNEYAGIPDNPVRCFGQIDWLWLSLRGSINSNIHSKQTITHIGMAVAVKMPWTLNNCLETAMKMQQIKLNYYDAAAALLMLGMLLGVYLKSAV